MISTFFWDIQQSSCVLFSSKYLKTKFKPEKTYRQIETPLSSAIRTIPFPTINVLKRTTQKLKTSHKRHT